MMKKKPFLGVRGGGFALFLIFLLLFLSKLKYCYSAIGSKPLQSPSPSISTQANPPLSLVSSLSDQGLELKVRGAN